MAHRAHLHDTHHFDVQRARRGIRHDVALLVAHEGDTNDGAKHRISRRYAVQRAAELRAEARLIERVGVPCLSLVDSRHAPEAVRMHLSCAREAMLTRAAELRREADVIEAARSVTTVVCGDALVTTYRHAA